MENATWNGLKYTAGQVAASYELEKNIRKASGKKELICPDPECSNPVLRYCHGEKRGPFFAHRNNCQCDYAEFDRQNEGLKKIKREIYNSLISKGFRVQQEMKIISHHYTHFLISLPSGKMAAIELGTQQTTANKRDFLFEQYQSRGIAVKWIVVSASNKAANEDETFFIKRSSLNENQKKDVLILNLNATEITQYVVDPNEYLFEGHPILYENDYEKIYQESSSVTNLTFEGDELTIEGFFERYETWLASKKALYKQRIDLIYEARGKEKDQEIQQNKKTECNEKQRDEMYEAPVIQRGASIYSKDICMQMLNSTNEETFYQGNNKLRFCLHCGEAKEATSFDLYTFYNKNQNHGCCKKCKSNNVPKKY